MICPHCSTGVSMEFEEAFGYQAPDYEESGLGYSLAWDHCPECEGFIVTLQHGKASSSKAGRRWTTIEEVLTEQILYPQNAHRPVPPEVPDHYRNEFIEACAVLPISPKASAALSRRLLQTIIREEYKIQHRSLAREIEDFISLEDTPSYLTQAVDAIRNVGNFAAHPVKDTHSGEIVMVEPGEAEWLLEVLEALFDFAFVQPRKLEARKKKLNDKLKALGKPSMKEP